MLEGSQQGRGAIGGRRLCHRCLVRLLVLGLLAGNLALMPRTNLHVLLLLVGQGARQNSLVHDASNVRRIAAAEETKPQTREGRCTGGPGGRREEKPAMEEDDSERQREGSDRTKQEDTDNV